MVADLILLTVQAGAVPLALKLDIIGMDPDKKYATDPMLSPLLYRDCKCSQKVYLGFYKPKSVIYMACFTEQYGQAKLNNRCQPLVSYLAIRLCATRLNNSSLHRNKNREQGLACMLN